MPAVSSFIAAAGVLASGYGASQMGKGGKAGYLGPPPEALAEMRKIYRMDVEDIKRGGEKAIAKSGQQLTGAGLAGTTVPSQMARSIAQDTQKSLRRLQSEYRAQMYGQYTPIYRQPADMSQFAALLGQFGQTPGSNLAQRSIAKSLKPQGNIGLRLGY